MKSKIGGWLSVLMLTGSGAQAMHAGDGLPVTSNAYVALSVQGSVGLLNGSALETVYTGVEGSRYKVSELDWDIKNVVMVGANLSVTLHNQIWLNAGLWGAATHGSGQMNDWDWLLGEQGSPWTDWSLSEVDVTRASLLDLNVAVEVLRVGDWGLRGIAGYKYNAWQWEDHGVRHIYSSNPAVPGGFRNDVAEENGHTGIIYEQWFHIPYLGAGLNYTNGGWVVDGYALVGPYVIASDRDQHLNRRLLFEEDFSGGQYFGAGVRAAYVFQSGLFLGAALDGQAIPEIIGDTTIVDQRTGARSTSGNTAGIANQAWMLALSGGYKF
ncbi:MAG: omptin family outer membrane protease [Verrucomicrobia bacterium]|nr:MAG: omptin family outer membrane protease [Verrucomicrobiota bacterium]